ncbi:MAG: acyl-CoA dehydrogenase family protein [Actinobacteria bacterium]|nr:acyl-CoA dehydrogenase family protein [Actinomycetota bacterium]
MNEVDGEETAELQAFREEFHTWLEGHNLGPVGAGFGRSDVEVAKAWQAQLYDAGFSALPPDKAAVVAEELNTVDVFLGTFMVGVSMAAPTIVAHGTDAQKERFLPPLYRGEEIWCQLFSEPGAGSDLAGLACRADRDGDEWVINGQKVWTSGAQNSDWGILLTRTDWDQPKHRGITYFLFPMRQAGVDIRPLKQITGAAHFNEVFLTDARVPHENILGELNGGWAVAMTTLANERTAIGGGAGRGSSIFDDLVALARQHGRAGDPVIRQALSDVYTRTQLLRYLGQRGGAAAMVLKLSYAQHIKALNELALAIEGPAGTLTGSWQDAFLGAPAIRIAGGSDEVQRNILGERVLGLPTEPRPDKTAPFRDLPR